MKNQMQESPEGQRRDNQIRAVNPNTVVAMPRSERPLQRPIPCPVGFRDLPSKNSTGSNWRPRVGVVAIKEDQEQKGQFSEQQRGTSSGQVGGGVRRLRCHSWTEASAAGSSVEMSIEVPRSVLVTVPDAARHNDKARWVGHLS